MSLQTIIDNNRTDKNTCHSYLPLYDSLLSRLKDTATNVLEIGICQGGSIKMWADFFTNATVYGLDIMPIEHVWDGIKNNDRILLQTSVDAYDSNFFNKTLSSKKFDFVLDDGPHTLESMMTFVKSYSTLLTDNGILILEDVQEYGWLEQLKEVVPSNLKKYIVTYDLRLNKN